MDEIQVTKKAWQSKTLWLALISAAAAFIPPVQKVMSEYPESYGLVLSGLFSFLRFATKGRVEIK